MSEEQAVRAVDIGTVISDGLTRALVDKFVGDIKIELTDEDKARIRATAMEAYVDNLRDESSWRKEREVEQAVHAAVAEHLKQSRVYELVHEHIEQLLADGGMSKYVEAAIASMVQRQWEIVEKRWEDAFSSAIGDSLRRAVGEAQRYRQ